MKLQKSGMKERRRHNHLRILFMDLRMFWQRFILRRPPERHLVAIPAAGLGSVRVLKSR